MTNSAPVIRFVRTSQEMREVARFRYAVYVEEMGRPQHDADHLRRIIIDSMDINAFVLAAWVDGRVVGTCRVNFCGMSDIGSYKTWYRAAMVAGRAWPHGTAVLTRLMVSPERRGSLLGAKLAAEAFQLGYSRGIDCALMDCNEHLLEFFAKLGWVLVEPFQHPDYGIVFTHRLDLGDLTHLKHVKSPFLRVLRSAPAHDRHITARPISKRTVERAGGRFVELSDAPRLNRISGLPIAAAA